MLNANELVAYCSTRYCASAFSMNTVNSRTTHPRTHSIRNTHTPAHTPATAVIVTHTPATTVLPDDAVLGKENIDEEDCSEFTTIVDEFSRCV